MQNRFDEALDAKEAAIRNFDATIGARLRAHTSGQTVGMDNPNAAMTAIQFTAYEGTMLRSAVPFVWAPDITRAVLQSSLAMPLEAVLDKSWLYTGIGWWWFGSDTPIIGQSCVGAEHKIPNQRPINALVYCYLPERNTLTVEVLSTVHASLIPGPAVISGYEWRVGKSLGETLECTAGIAEKMSKNPRSAGLQVGGDPKVWASYWNSNIATAMRFFAAASLWLTQRILVEEPAQASRGARRRAEKAGATSDLRVVRLRRTEHAKESEAAEAGMAGSREYSCQWVVRGHWRNQFYSTTKTHRPIWIDPYTKGPDDKPLKVSSTLFTVDR